MTEVTDLSLFKHPLAKQPSTAGVHGPTRRPPPATPTGQFQGTRRSRDSIRCLEQQNTLPPPGRLGMPCPAVVCITGFRKNPATSRTLAPGPPKETGDEACLSSRRTRRIAGLFRRFTGPCKQVSVLRLPIPVREVLQPWNGVVPPISGHLQAGFRIPASNSGPRAVELDTLPSADSRQPASRFPGFGFQLRALFDQTFETLQPASPKTSRLNRATTTNRLTGSTRLRPREDQDKPGLSRSSPVSSLRGLS
jgi:hypothetical protein